MSKKPEFRPRITRVKLNPEQAVLRCDCYGEGWGTRQNVFGEGAGWSEDTVYTEAGNCLYNTKEHKIPNITPPFNPGCWSIAATNPAS